MDDRRRDGGTNSTLRIKEHGMHLTFNEHDDDDDDDDDDVKIRMLPQRKRTASPLQRPNQLTVL